MQAQLHSAGWKTRALGAYGASFALLVVVVNYLPLPLGGSSSTLASVFLVTLQHGLPAGWTLIYDSENGPRESSFFASLVLAFLASYPLGAYATMRLVSRDGLRGTALIPLVLCAVALFYAGSVFGYYLGGSTLVVFSGTPERGVSPIFEGLSFYVFMMKYIVVWALCFTAPLYVLSLIRCGRWQG